MTKPLILCPSCGAWVEPHRYKCGKCGWIVVKEKGKGGK